MNRSTLALFLALSSGVARAQTPATPPAAAKPPAAAPKPAAAAKAAPLARPAVPKAPSVIDEVIQLVKGGMSEAFVVKQALKAGKALDLAPADMLRMKQAGVSENIINALMEGPGAVVKAAAPAPTPTMSVSIEAPKPASADYNTDLASLGCKPEPRKRVLAISEFDFGGVKTQIQAIFGTQVDIGKGIMALLTKQLQQDGKYRIVERANLKTLLGEQDAGGGNRVKQGSNAKVGKIIGADAYLMGTIVVFGRDDKKKTTSLGGVSSMIPGGGALGGLSFGKKTDKAVVSIAYRLVDTETSEVIDTATETGDSKRESKTFSIVAAGGGSAGGFGQDMTSSNFAETIIGEATMACIKNLTNKMSEQQGKVKMRRVEVEGRLAEVAGKNLYITTGGNDGVNKCDKFEVSKIVKEVKDPVTKEVIDLVVEPVGEMLITEVRDRMSVGVYRGSAPPEVNMAVRKVMPPDIMTTAPAETPAPAPPTTPATAAAKN